jgi:hypothetical protein
MHLCPVEQPQWCPATPQGVQKDGRTMQEKLVHHDSWTAAVRAGVPAPQGNPANDAATGHQPLNTVPTCANSPSAAMLLPMVSRKSDRLCRKPGSCCCMSPGPPAPPNKPSAPRRGRRLQLEQTPNALAGELAHSKASPRLPKCNPYSCHSLPTSVQCWQQLHSTQRSGSVQLPQTFVRPSDEDADGNACAAGHT